MKKITLYLFAIITIVSCENDDNNVYKCEKFHLEESYIITYPSSLTENIDTLWLESTWVSDGLIEYIDMPTEYNTDSIKYHCYNLDIYISE